MRLPLMLALACSAVGCGGDNGNGSDGGQGDMAGPGCNFTLSGSISTMGFCTATASWDPAKPALAIAIATNATAFSFSSQLSVTNDFTAGKSWNQGSVVIAGAETIDGGTAAWQATAHNTSGMPDQGSFTLDISDPGPVIAGNSGALIWASPHGTLDATMPAVTGSTATGTVTAQVSF